MREHCEMIFENNIQYRLSYNSQKIRITFSLFKIEAHIKK